MAFIAKFRELYFGKQLDFRVRLFNLLAIAGMLICACIALVGVLSGFSGWNILLNLLAGVLSVGLLIYCRRSGKYQRCYIITIVVVFLLFFPLLFFTAGGYHSGMPCFFVFAVVFTAFMLEGRVALLFSALELLVFTGICYLAYQQPELITQFDGESALLTDIVVGFLIVGAVLGITMYAQIRMYRNQQRDLETSREEALRLSQVKNIFLANMSHEIRTPINVMIGMTEMILRESGDETVQHYARKSESAGEMLLVLVNNILDISKAESGKLELHQEPYQTIKLLQELADIGAERAHNRGLSFFVRSDETFPRALVGDVLRLKQIGVNFLSNAAKYTSEGAITLSCSQKPGRREGEILLCLAVSDTGVGIRPENLPILFEAFTRVDLPLHQTIEGTGMGLAISKELTEQMGGEIFVESEYGVGSVFWVEIPQMVEDTASIGAFDAAERSGAPSRRESFQAPEAKILLVDDNLANLETLCALLARTHIGIDTVRSGRACLEAVRREVYDVILLDYMMPELDGIETFRLLRQEPGFHTPVVALTANAVAGARERFLEEGFAAYLTKPISAVLLEETLLSLLPPDRILRCAPQERKWDAEALANKLAETLAPNGVLLAEGLRHASGDLALFASVADIFCRRYAESCKQIAAFVETGNEESHEALVHLTHSLKSGAAAVGAAELSALSAQMEAAGKRRDESLLRACLPQLELLHQRAQESLLESLAILKRVTERGAAAHA